MSECGGGHRFFVASVVGVEQEGKVVLIAMCTGCGETFSETFAVSSGETPLLIEEKT